ncbi:MAG TPA: tRNA lysidine(34) synthetase TilS [Pyrinomonadaceae bacterium]|nr:tRNA lysidine(34) synthetase TilS [Pyrinomonadaceae bacterium]
MASYVRRRGDRKQVGYGERTSPIAPVSMLKSIQQMKIRRRTGRRAARSNSRQKHPSLSRFAKNLLREWRRLHLPISNITTIVGVSGGADSVALLLALDELIRANKLKVKLIVAHIDHRLRKTSADDARWVRALVQQLGYDISFSRVSVKNSRDNLEQAARLVRYKSLSALAQKRQAALVLTAHTMDDQAETILLNLLRGSGAEGLGGIEPVRPLTESAETLLARPLIPWARRHDTEQYCGERQIDFRHDEMNEDETFARVRIRRQLLPLMETFNPRISEAISRTGELLRDDDEALNRAARRLLELSTENPAKCDRLRTDLLAGTLPALRRRALRLWLEKCRGDLRRLEFAHIRAVENLVTENRGARTIELPGGSSVCRKDGLLTFNRRTSGRSKP